MLKIFLDQFRDKLQQCRNSAHKLSLLVQSRRILVYWNSTFTCLQKIFAEDESGSNILKNAYQQKKSKMGVVTNINIRLLIFTDRYLYLIDGPNLSALKIKIICH